jgi:hypothetical protein
MRPSPVSLLVLILAVVAVVGGWMLYAKSEHDRFVAVNRVLHSRSEFGLTYTIEHTDGPIAQETWTIRNVDGNSTAAYAVTDRHGTRASFVEQLAGYGATFLFEKLVQDGIWNLETRPFRGSSAELHVVRVEQAVGGASGSHRFMFSDAAYIATEAGREYEIHLDPHKPVPNLVDLQSTSTADPRYRAIENDFERFGSPRFKQTVAQARAKVLKG